jgi:hypothetical protein
MFVVIQLAISSFFLRPSKEKRVGKRRFPFEIRLVLFFSVSVFRFKGKQEYVGMTMKDVIVLSWLVGCVTGTATIYKFAASCFIFHLKKNTRPQ